MASSCCLTYLKDGSVVAFLTNLRHVNVDCTAFCYAVAGERNTTTTHGSSTSNDGEGSRTVYALLSRSMVTFELVVVILSLTFCHYCSRHWFVSPAHTIKILHTYKAKRCFRFVCVIIF